MRMVEMMRKSVLAGIGMAALADEKVQQLTDRLIQKGERCRQEGKSPLHNLQQTIETRKDECLKRMRKEFNLLTTNHLTELEHTLEQELGKIDKRLAGLEKQLKTRSK